MFFIVDQGHRIQTPIDKLLVHQQVDPVDRIASAHAVSGQQKSDGREAREAAIYRDNAEHPADREPTRERVVNADQIMVPRVITVFASDSVSHAWQRIEENRIHHLPVVDEDQTLMGILSDRDILRYFIRQQGQPNIGKREVAKIMSSQVITAQSNTSIRSLAEVMSSRKIGAIPIVDDVGHLQGIATRSDIMKVLVRESPIELWT